MTWASKLTESKLGARKYLGKVKVTGVMLTTPPTKWRLVYKNMTSSAVCPILVYKNMIASTVCQILSIKSLLLALYAKYWSIKS